ncbi:gliding motility-associated C-terminal domain-containing protein [Cytophaga sp. FL35]|uniref:gliding motility-associated C-terminal domain-containing protein n=1 Tax=Cytophaga sp. FL35 TaxID=1904456 RepID=UPI001653D434|nr:gliding motility-associated C-terminal domain-containing protein [Cytophaga sp. FL35]MBC6999493.1 gliding motility-associated C-terminal domain-containing protein [Cytophaga sp. FL35]
MKNTLYIPFLLLSAGLCAQTALYNTGNLRIHEGGEMGFHTDLINDGSFDENQGLAGFYSTDSRSINGSLPPTFQDVEFLTQTGTFLNNPVNVSNNANFISGDVITIPAQPGITLNFLDTAFPSGENNASKVNGYSSVSGQQDFTFPVGDSEQLRQLSLNSEGINNLAKAAYFFEDPNSPSEFPAFSTNSRANGIDEISTTEFWRLEGSVPSSVQLTWNNRSDIGSLSGDVEEIVVVGWSKITNQWEMLGGPASVGDLINGVAISGSFVPNDYEILTFGAFGEPRDFLDLENYFVSPNGDGINDFLEIPELALSPNNHMMIFDRQGSKVFEKTNYTNEFNGLSNQNNFVINREGGLPSGVYFYIVSLDDLNLEFQGFLYLAND